MAAQKSNPRPPQGGFFPPLLPKKNSAKGQDACYPIGLFQLHLSYKIKRYSGMPYLFTERKREKTAKQRFELLHGFLIFLIDFRQFRFASSFRFILISHLPSCQYYLLRSSLLCDKLSFSGTTKVAAMTIFLFQVSISLPFLSNVQ